MALPSYSEALEIMRRVLAVRSAASAIEVAVSECAGFVLAQPAYADADYPRFDNTSVDGYALGEAEDRRAGAALRIADSLAAGENRSIRLAPGTAVRVLTGGPLPDGTRAVVMQEDVVATDQDSNGRSITLNHDVAVGQNIRRRGAEIREGELLLELGTRMTPGAIALLASAGQRVVSVFPAPRVALLTMGDELVDAGCDAGPTQIRDTNLPMLRALVAEAGGTVVAADRIIDDPGRLKEWLLRQSGESDLIVVSGGASVGDRDHVGPTVIELGGVQFHGVSMRPGKPILFGLIGGTPTFGLPGNPASTYVGFAVFVAEAIARLSGDRRAHIRWTVAKLGVEHPCMGREDFLRVRLEMRNDGLWAMPVSEQASFGLRSLAEASSLARVSAASDVPFGGDCLVMELGTRRIGI